MNDTKYINSDELETLLNTPPNWMIRKGNFIIIIFISLCLLISYLIKYPEIVKGRIELTFSSSPITIESKATGKIILLVKDNEHVTENQTLSYIESETNFSHYLYLKKLIKEINDTNIANVFTTSNKFLELGPISETYTNLISECTKLIFSKNNNNYDQKVLSLKDEMIYLDDKLSKTVKEISNTLEQLILIKNQYSRDSLLYRQKAISILELEKSYINTLSTQNNLVQLNKEQVNLKMQINQNINQIKETTLDNTINREFLMNNIQKYFSSLLTQISIWESKYLLKSPDNGRITFFDIRDNKQFVLINQEIFKLDRENISLKDAIVEYPIESSGKIKIGQKVFIKLDNYPYLEYGFLEGKIENINQIPKNGHYICYIKFLNGLKTNYNKKIQNKYGLQGDAEIVTENVRIIDRIFKRIKSILS